MSNSVEHNHLYFEKLGQDFDGFMSDYDVKRRAILISSLIDHESKDLESIEIGCGNGAITKHIIASLPQLTVTDISSKLSQETGNKFNRPWREADACNLPFESCTYSNIISSECIEHTPDPAQALKEMCRILKPGGTLIVTSPNRLWYPVLLVAKLLRLRKFQGPEHWLWPTSAAKIIRSQGLKIEVITGCHLFPWQIPGAKSVLPWLDRLGTCLFPLYINFCIKASKPGTA